MLMLFTHTHTQASLSFLEHRHHRCFKYTCATIMFDTQALPKRLWHARATLMLWAHRGAPWRAALPHHCPLGTQAHTLASTLATPSCCAAQRLAFRAAMYSFLQPPQGVRGTGAMRVGAACAHTNDGGVNE